LVVLGGSWKEAYQDHDDDELNCAFTVMHPWWIPCAQGFPLKEERNGKWNNSWLV
jgi:hypothetical protein